MKILLITTYPVSRQTFEIDKCKNKYQAYAYFINKYLTEIEGVEVILRTVCPLGRSYRYKSSMGKMKIPQIDHTILVDERGFKNRNNYYFKKIRSVTRGLVCSVGSTGIHSGGEDKIFYLEKLITTSHNCLECPIDEDVVYPNQSPAYITILVSGYEGSFIPIYVQRDQTMRKLIRQKYSSRHFKPQLERRRDRTEEIVAEIEKFGTKNKDDNLIIVKMFTNGGVDVYDNVSEKRRKVEIQNMAHYYKEINTATMFFVTHSSVDIKMLYELAAANVVIAAPKGIISSTTVKELHIVEFTDSINWTTMFNRLNQSDIREKLIESGHTWKCAVDHIHQILKKHDLEKEELEQKRSFIEQNNTPVDKRKIVSQSRMLKQEVKSQWQKDHEQKVVDKRIEDEEREIASKKQKKTLRVLQ